MSSPGLDAHPRVEQWLTFEADGTLTVRSGKVELGQRVSTAVEAVAAAELRLPPERVHAAPVATGASPDEGVTSGSASIESSSEAIRLAGATARRELIARAAAALGVAPGALELAGGLVRERDGNRSLSFRELVPDGRLDAAVDTTLDDPPAVLAEDAFARLRARRAEALATGAERFLHDRREPGLLHARVVRPPHLRARLASLDDPPLAHGVHVVRKGSFLAVAAEDEYAAVRAAQGVAVRARWDDGGGLDGGDVFERLCANPRETLWVVEGTPVDDPVPDPEPPPHDARATLEVRYERPYLMHGALGPSTAMARFDDGRLEVWTHSQGVYPLRETLAQTLGLAVGDVRLEHVPGAGCYGHNGADDAALDAALVACAIPGRSVLLTWSRDDEHAWEPYGSAMAMAMRGSVDAAGRICAWSHETFSDTHIARPRPGSGADGPSRLLAPRWLPDPPPPFVAAPARGTHTGIHRNAEPYYDIASPRVVKHLVRGLPHRTSALRTLGGFGNVFAVECFVDELAHAAGLDPLALRLEHLADPRAREVLERAAAGIGWGTAGRPLGLGFARYKNRQAYVAVGVEVAVDDSAKVHLRRAVVAGDAGRVVDADGLASQLEGGFLQAASWTLHEQVRHDAGGVVSRDWDSYAVLRFDEVPDIEVALLDRRDAPPLGAGEAACGPSGAAIANAVFAATGLRVRRLPITPEALRAAALA